MSSPSVCILVCTSWIKLRNLVNTKGILKFFIDLKSFFIFLNYTKSMVPWVRSITNMGKILYRVASMYNIIFLRQILSSIPGMSTTVMFFFCSIRFSEIGITNSILSIELTSSLFLFATCKAENCLIPWTSSSLVLNGVLSGSRIFPSISFLTI